MAIAGEIDSMDWWILSALGKGQIRFGWNEKGVDVTWLIQQKIEVSSDAPAVTAIRPLVRDGCGERQSQARVDNL